MGLTQSMTYNFFVVSGLTLDSPPPAPTSFRNPTEAEAFLSSLNLNGVCRLLDWYEKPTPALCVVLQSPILQFHSGYQTSDLAPVVRKLHLVLSFPPDDKLKAIRNKYSHK